MAAPLDALLLTKETVELTNIILAHPMPAMAPPEAAEFWVKVTFEALKDTVEPKSA
jgi:hypothetical protein